MKYSDPKGFEPSQAKNYGVKVWRSEDLFGEARELIIEHDRLRYRLIKTKSGKLILNK